MLKNAPEKVYVIGAAAVALKALFKRFGVETIVVSESGVKEGYLRLVLDGREEGDYALLTPPASSERETAPALEDVMLVAEPKPDDAPAAPEPPASEPADAPQSPAPEKPSAPAPRRPGRPKKTPEQAAQPKPAAKKPAAKKPAAKKPAAEKPAVKKAEPAQAAKSEESSAPKRRGRPKKNAE